MGTAFTVIIALLVFGFLIFIHEFGHYITARLFKVTINEFSIGMGPKLVTYTSKKTNIQYSLGMFPIGGYVAMVGEDEESDDPNAFNKKPAWQRFIITAAGATVNIVAGFLAMIIIVSCVNTANTVYGGIVNDERLTESYGTDTLDLSVRSDASGLRVGDEIVKINGKRVKIYDELSYEIMRNGVEPVDVTVIRDGEQMTIEDVVFPTVISDGEKFGVVDFMITDYLDKNPISVFSMAIRRSALVMRMCWESVFDLITGRYSLSAVSGPVGISSAIGEAARYGFISLLNITVIISMNLGFMNLLPIPALDGGRIVVILIEMITRKKLPARVEAIINGVGLAALLLLSFVIMIKDVIGLF
ncbi:MAG: site-2 protease family protein [Clostridia bacterium]|nr:site-2 protease family protein [Clostridia bacterium]MBR3680975.1 site-2 protease family protein [Clostridia bacterium]